MGKIKDSRHLAPPTPYTQSAHINDVRFVLPLCAAPDPFARLPLCPFEWPSFHLEDLQSQQLQDLSDDFRYSRPATGFCANIVLDNERTGSQG